MADNFKPGSDAPLNVVAVCGSLNTHSKTRMALPLALKGAGEYGAHTKMLSLRDYEFVFCGEVDEQEYPPDVFRLRKEIEACDGIIVGTPEYHGSMSGALKKCSI